MRQLFFKETKISNVKFELRTKLFEILWSSKDGICAATAASKGKHIIER